MQVPLLPAHPLLRTHDDGTQVILFAFLCGAKRGYSPTAVLKPFISVLNQEENSCLIWGHIFKLFVDHRSQAQSKTLMGILNLYLSRKGLQELACSFTAAPCFTSTHIHIWELFSTTTTLLQLGLYSRCLAQGHLGGSNWASKTFKHLFQSQVCFHDLQAFVAPRLNRKFKKPSSN